MKKNNIVYGIIITLLAVVGFFSFFYHNEYHLEKLQGLSNIVPVVIIGSGPAGLSAALYTARAHYMTLIISGNQPGGQLVDVKYIENWPGRKKTTGLDAMDELEEQVTQFGAHSITDSVKEVDFSQWPFLIKTENGLDLRALSVIIATGGTPRKLTIPGVQEFWGKGVGTCSICEAPFSKGQDVAVVGGGDTAAERVLQLAVYANKVYMIVREPHLDANKTVQEYLKQKKNVTIITSSEIKEIKGNKDGITEIVTENRTTNQEQALPIKSVYFAIGTIPNSELFQSYLKLDKDKYIVVNCFNQKTSLAGIMAAGVVATSDKMYGKAGVALGDGIKAGLDTIEFLEGIGFNPSTAQNYQKQFFIPKKSKNREFKEINSLRELQKIIKERELVIVDVYALFCSSCRQLIPVLQSIHDEFANKITIIKTNYDKAPDFVKQFSIMQVPQVLLFKKGELVSQKNTVSAEDIQTMLQSPSEISANK